MDKKTNNNQNLPSSWRKVKLGEFLEINPSIKLERGKEYPYIDMSDVQPFSQIYDWFKRRIFNGSGAKFENGDTIFARITPCLENGKIAYINNLSVPGFGSTEFLVLRGKRGISDSRFIYYLSLSHKVRKLAEQSMIGVSGRQRVERGAFEKIEVEVPEDPNEQKRIADILSAFDDKIEVNNKIVKILEEMAREIFKEWFDKKSKVKSQKSKFWETMKVGDLVWIISGYPFSSKLYNKSKKGIGVVTIKNVQDGNFITECDSFIEEEKIPKNINKECLISDGDILLSLTGNVGRVCFVYCGKYLLNQRVAKIKPKNPNDRAFIYFLFRQPDMQNLLINMAKGSAQPNLSPVETGEIEITIPSREILDRLNKAINPMYEKLIKLKVENKKLAAMRDLLLTKLMIGEILIKN